MPRSQILSKTEHDARKYLMFLYGIPGVGKTTFASSIPGHHIIESEAGTEGVQCYSDAVQDYSEFKVFINEIITDKKRGWKTEAGKAVRPIEMIVIDTYDALMRSTCRWLVENEKFIIGGKATKFSNADDVPFGKCFSRASDQLIFIINRLRQLGFGVLLLSHMKDRLQKWRGQDVTFVGPDVTPTSAKRIIGECGAVGFFTAREEVKKVEGSLTPEYVVENKNVRYIEWNGTFTKPAKHRLPNFPEVTIVERIGGWQTYLRQFEEAWKISETEISAPKTMMTE